MTKPMEVLFIRHGQGIHNTGIPDRLGEAGIHIMKWTE